MICESQYLSSEKEFAKKNYHLTAKQAAQIAKAINARKLILLTDTEGVLDKNRELISSLKVNETEALIQDGTIQGGMIPKTKCCLDALANGVKKAHIIDGRKKHALLLEIFTKGGIGTEIIK